MSRLSFLTMVLALAGSAPASQLPKATKSKIDNKAVLRVIEAIDAACVKNAESKTPLKGDALTEHLVRTAATEALKFGAESRLDAFTTGIGIGLDRTNLLAQNKLTKAVFGGIEAPAAAKQRQANLRLKKVSMWDRNDLTLHWSLSVGLAGRLGAKDAELFGLNKEVLDLMKGGGWSWSDLAADQSGIHFAERLRTGKINLHQVESDFKVKKVLPESVKLDEPLDQEKFKAKYGTLNSPSITKELVALRKKTAEFFNEQWPAAPKK